jgi:hypothetical protein
LRTLVKLICVVGIAFIFIGYGTDKLLQTITGVTFLQGDTIDNDVVSLKTGITVIEYDNHVFVKQSSSYVRFITAFKYIDDKLFDGLLQDFLEEFIEMDMNSEVSTFDVIKMFLVVSFIPVLLGIILIGILKAVGKRIFSSWFFAATCFSLLVLFFATYQPIIDNLANVRMLFTYNSEASKTTMEILQSAVNKKAENRDKANSLLSSILSNTKEQNEMSLYLGDQMKAIENSPNSSSPPNLVNIIESEQYQNADEKEKKKLEEEQIKNNANEMRKLIFWIYSSLDMGKSNSNTEFSAYSQDLVDLYYKSQDNPTASF